MATNFSGSQYVQTPQFKSGYTPGNFGALMGSGTTSDLYGTLRAKSANSFDMFSNQLLDVV